LLTLVLLLAACGGGDPVSTQPAPPRHDLDVPSDKPVTYRTTEGTFTVLLTGPASLIAERPGRYQVVLANPSRNDTNLEVGGVGFRAVVVNPERQVVWYTQVSAQSYLRLVELKPGESVVLRTWSWGGTDIDGESLSQGANLAGAAISLERPKLSNTVHTIVTK
jgi:hypothetical protein